LTVENTHINVTYQKPSTKY